jgi:hypothetical protein
MLYVSPNPALILFKLGFPIDIYRCYNMYAQTRIELHAMAFELHLNRKAFVEHDCFPHYKLSPGLMRAAMLKGAYMFGPITHLEIWLCDREAFNRVSW